MLLLRRVPFRWGFHYFMQRIFLFLLLTFLSKTKNRATNHTTTKLYALSHHIYTFIYRLSYTIHPLPYALIFDISLIFRIRWHHSTRSLSSSPLPCTQSRKHISVHNPLIIISDLPFPIIISRVQHSLIARILHQVWCCFRSGPYPRIPARVGN